MPPKTNWPAERWAYWLPFAVIAAKRSNGSRELFNPSYSPLQRLRVIHSRVLEKLQLLGVPWATISRWELDDPRLSDSERDTRIGAAVERRRTRIHERETPARRRNR